MNFGFLDGVRNKALHGISHHGNSKKNLHEFHLVNKFHTEMVAGMVEKMKSIDEGNGSLLDNTMLLFGSNQEDGHVHQGRNVPIVLIGGKNCGIKSGRTLDFNKSPEKDQHLCNLHLSFLHKMGIMDKKFGDSNYALDIG